MGGSKLAGIFLLVAGALALVYGGFTYPRSHDANVGPMGFSWTADQRVSIPVWAGVGGIVLGGVLLLMGARKS
jgi:hypothetical protein